VHEPGELTPFRCWRSIRRSAYLDEKFDAQRFAHAILDELTFREALRLGHSYVGTEHLLLALLDVVAV